jgi:hypothetical protein
MHSTKLNFMIPGKGNVLWYWGDEAYESDRMFAN